MEKSPLTGLSGQDIDRGICSIIDLIRDVVYWLDPEGRIQFISDEIIQYGYSPGDLKGTGILEIVHPEDREKARYRINERRSAARKTKSCEMRLLVRNGENSKGANESDFELFLVSAEGLYVIDTDDSKKFLGTLGLAHNISRNRDIEAALRKSEERTRVILDTLPDGYYETTVRGKFSFVNSSFCRLTGYGADEIIGKNLNILFPQKTLEEIYETVRDIGNAQNRMSFFNWEMICKDGRRKHTEISVSPIHESGGRIEGYRGIVRDVSERKRMEEEILLARKIEAIGIMAGGIAHDYNNALTAVLGNLSLAKIETGDKNSDLMEILNDAEKASLRVLELTKRLSSFAKGGKPRLVPVERGVLLDVIRDTAGSALKDYEGNCDIVAEDDLYTVEIDAIQLSHVIEHIVNNAVESIREGGVISIQARNVEVDSEKTFNEITLHRDKYVLISVSDTGSGIPEEMMYKIFDPYFTTKEMASGMGLAISYAIIKRHHGFIEIKSKPGEGTVVYIYLPAHQGNSHMR